MKITVTRTIEVGEKKLQATASAELPDMPPRQIVGGSGIVHGVSHDEFGPKDRINEMTESLARALSFIP